MRVFFLGFLVMICASLEAATILVPAEFPTIQEAIVAAAKGDTVLVSPGTYMENLDFKGKAICVKSSNGPVATVIDGGASPYSDFGSVVAFIHNEGSDSVMDGFTLTNGTGTYFSNYDDRYFGGGVYCFESSPKILNNIIKNNQPVSGGGGGIACINWFTGGDYAPMISNNVISGNSAEKEGGGILNFLCSPDISMNKISRNSGEVGGGIYCEAGPLNTFKIVNNVIDRNGALGCGGGIATDGGVNLSIMNNLIKNNMAGDSGGGFYCWRSGVTASKNIVEENSAHDGGGFMLFCMDDDMTLESNIFNANTAARGGGLFCSAYCFNPPVSITITNSTFAGNSADMGGGLYFDHEFSNVQPLTLTNTILWYNSASAGPAVYLSSQLSPAVLKLTYSNVEDGKSSIHAETGFGLHWVGGMIDSDPLFVNRLQGDFHLTFNSPCRGSGDNSAVQGQQDFEGDPRIFQGTVDLGADEFFRHFYVTGDAIPGGSVIGKLVGLPGNTPLALFIGSGILDPPIATQWGDFYLQAPWQVFPIPGPIPSSGILMMPAYVPGALPAPYDLPMQALIGLESDSMSNLEVLKIR